MGKFYSFLFIIFYSISVSARSYDVSTITDLIVDHTGFFTEKEIDDQCPVKFTSVLIDHTKLSHIMSNYSERFSHHVGGGATNTLKGLSKLRHQCAIIGKTGNDHWSYFYKNHLRECNIHLFAKEASCATAQVICLVDQLGRKSMLSHIPKQSLLLPTDVPKNVIDESKFLYLEAYSIYQKDALLFAAKTAKEKGVKIAFSLCSLPLVEANREFLLQFIDDYVDVLFCNEEESKAITLMNDCEKACQFLSNLSSIAVVHMGETGGYVSDGIIWHYNPFPVDNIIDDTGAGDLFVAGFLHGLMTGKEIMDCASYGAALGAAAVQVEGADLPSEVIIRVLSKRN